MAVVAQDIGEKHLLTCAQIKEYKCTWTGKFPRDHTYDVRKRYDSPKFMTGEYKWDIEVYFGGFDEASKDYVSVRLYLHGKLGSKTPSNFKAAIELSIVNKNNREHFKQSITRSKENFPEHCFHMKRVDLLSSPIFLPNDELTLVYRISLYPDENQTMHSEITDKSSSTLQCQSAQMSHFAQILDNPEYSDFQLVVGETRIKVHKCILATHSPVFAAMFRYDMLEKNRNEVVIEDIDLHVVRQLIRFVYVGEAGEIDDSADKLFIAADKYELDSLKELCERKLIERLNIQNLYETLRFVDQFDANELKSMAIQFVVKNAKKLSNMEEFKKSIETLSSGMLAQVVCALLAKPE